LRGTERSQEVDMTQENIKEGKSVLYWIALGTIFAAFIMVALS
jgi:hypothetical protein